jgi:hypothetical protein
MEAGDRVMYGAITEKHYSAPHTGRLMANA